MHLTHISSFNPASETLNRKTAKELSNTVKQSQESRPQPGQNFSNKYLPIQTYLQQMTMHEK